ncbi:hypothetical protein JTE90_003606 [Oedothorax gibbosus]|uniref:Uncharacterized protein n=1 Tax=Oedothorax gibbosus TaxID=931172 RepID=A0AAV6VBE8_9ARAC|nr:hypothetical protein JTE90_003606 [Oedothorax gibbosus]
MNPHHMKRDSFSVDSDTVMTYPLAGVFRSISAKVTHRVSPLSKPRWLKKSAEHICRRNEPVVNLFPFKRCLL